MVNKKKIISEMIKNEVRKVLTEKTDFEVYHQSYTSAVNAALEYAESKGYAYDKDETYRKIGHGPRKPSEGNTNKFTITLTKDGKEQRKALHIQIYGMRSSYELNAYIQ